MEGLLFNNLFSKASVFGPSGGLTLAGLQSGIISQIFTSDPINIAINTVNPGNCIVLCWESGGGMSYGDWGSSVNAHGQITSSTNLQIQLGGKTDKSVAIGWQVVELAGFKSLQTGLKVLSDSSDNDITINAVDVDKSVPIVFCQGYNTNFSDQAYELKVIPYLSSSNNLKLRNNLNDTHGSCVWFVLEFN